MKRAKKLLTLVTVATLAVSSSVTVFAANSATTTTTGLPSTTYGVTEAPVAPPEMETPDPMADVTTGKVYPNLAYTQETLYGFNSEYLGVYPVITGMPGLSREIYELALKANDKYATGYDSNDTGTTSGLNTFMISYKITDSNRYADIMVQVTYDQNFATRDSKGVESRSFYVDKETMTEITKEAYDAGVAAMTTEAPAADVVMVPLRDSLTPFGLDMDWNAATKTVAISNAGKPVTNITVDVNEYTVNGNVVALSSAPTMVGDSVYVPVDFFEQVFGATVTMNADGMVTITPPVKDTSTVKTSVN